MFTPAHIINLTPNNSLSLIKQKVDTKLSAIIFLIVHVQCRMRKTIHKITACKQTILIVMHTADSMKEFFCCWLFPSASVKILTPVTFLQFLRVFFLTFPKQTLQTTFIKRLQIYMFFIFLKICCNSIGCHRSCCSQSHKNINRNIVFIALWSSFRTWGFCRSEVPNTRSTKVDSVP